MNKAPTSIPELVTAFQEARQRLGAGDPFTRALANLVAAALERLAAELSDEGAGAQPTGLSSQPASNSPLFGGVFTRMQTPPEVREPEAAPPPPADLNDPDAVAGRAAQLFADALRMAQVAGGNAGQLDHLDADVDEVAGHLLALANTEAAAKQPALDSLREAIDRLEQLDDEEAALQARLTEGEEQRGDLRQRVEKLKGDVSALDADLESLRAEKARLEVELQEARQSGEDIRRLKAEYERMPEQLAQDKQDLEQLKQRHADIAAEAFAIRERVKTTRELVEELDKLMDPAISERLKEIWKAIPQDLFDQRME